MYVTVHTYYARGGEEDAVIALHEEWQRHVRARAGGCLSSELLHDARDPRQFVAVAHYESVDAALSAARDPEYAAWQHRLESLCQAAPECSEYQVALIGPECTPGMRAFAERDITLPTKACPEAPEERRFL